MARADVRMQEMATSQIRIVRPVGFAARCEPDLGVSHGGVWARLPGLERPWGVGLSTIPHATPSNLWLLFFSSTHTETVYT